MLSKDVTSLREELGYSMSELARALSVPVDEVVAWESGERFPTKRSVERMRHLLTEHRAQALKVAEAATTSHESAASEGAAIWSTLADPELWLLFRKLAASAELRKQVLELAADYPDPARLGD